MTAAITPVARYLVRFTFQVLWVLLIMRALEGAWRLIRKGVCKLAARVAATEK
jgi:hypothetical protein